MAQLQRDTNLASLPPIADEVEAVTDTLDKAASDTPGSSSAIDLQALARKVYALLMKEARLERERRGRSIHW